MPVGCGALLMYGASGFPLALVGLPLYAYLPTLYAETLVLALLYGLLPVVLKAASLALLRGFTLEGEHHAPPPHPAAVATARHPADKRMQLNET